jgi:hypothetical protein
MAVLFLWRTIMKHPHQSPPAKPKREGEDIVRHPTTFQASEPPPPAPEPAKPEPEPVAEKPAPTPADLVAANQSPPAPMEGWTWDNSSGRYKKNAPEA